MSEEINSKEDISPETVISLAKRAEIGISPERIEDIAQRLSELFDLAGPLEDVTFVEFEVTQPFDPRWTGDSRS